MSSTLTPRPTATSAVLHGRHPLRGYPVTWHITPRTPAPGGVVTFLVEHVDGHIDDEFVWDLAEKESVIMSTAEVAELVRRVSLKTV